MRVALRADASAELGIGHVTRILALGHALKEAGAVVCLITRDLGVTTTALAPWSSIEQITLPRAVKSWEEDAAETAEAVRAWRPDRVVVDHYVLDARWHRVVRAALGAQIAAIDDLGDRDLDVDALVDQNHADDHRAKYAHRVGPGTKLLCGPRFALLSPGYATAPRYTFRKHVDSIGIFLGGADNAGLSGDVVRACRVVAKFTGVIEVATTRANPHLAKLRATCQRWPQTLVTVDLPDLAAFFARHDLQIGAGGGATWERCCVGSPTLGLICADNQRVVIPELARLGLLAVLPSDEENCVSSIGRSVAALIQDSARRAAMSNRSRQLVDGLGARRVALYFAAPRIKLRRASSADANMLYAWRNNPVTRAMSHDAQEIAWSAHENWLARVLADPNRLLLVATVGSVPVGVIRFDRDDRRSAIVSLYLDPALHGLGLGSAMLLAGERHATSQPEPPDRFVATVLETNAGSQRLFRSAGYRPDGRYLTKAASLVSGGELQA